MDILTKVIQLFNSVPDITKMGFLSSFFVTTPESFTDSEFCDLDLVYEGEEVAPTVTDLNTGAVSLIEEKFTNKQIPFPVYALDSPAQISKLMERQPGESAFVTARINWLSRLAYILVQAMGRMTKMIRRSMELQAAQVLQTGDIILTDENGNQTFKLNLKPNPTHFPTVAVPWSELNATATPATGGTPLDDLDITSDVVRDDGLVDITTAIMGDQAWKDFIRNDWVRENLKKDVLNMGALNPEIASLGGKRMGYIDYGAYRYLIYTYNARYNPFKDKDNKIKFLDPNKVILLPDISDLDFRRLFGGVPTVRTDTAFDQIFGTSKTQIGNEYDIQPRVYWDVKTGTFIAEIKSRPLMFPVSINRFACITVA